MLFNKPQKFIWISLGLFLGTILWDIIPLLPNLYFLTLLLVIPFIGTKLISLALSVYVVVKTIKNFKTYYLVTIATLILCMTAFLNPMETPISDYEFKANLDDRMQVIQLFKEHKLKENKNNGHYEIPFKYGALGIDIIPIGKENLYFVDGGMLDNISGYYYSEDGTPPKETEFRVIEEDIVGVEKITDKWYYVSCT